MTKKETADADGARRSSGGATAWGRSRVVTLVRILAEGLLITGVVLLAIHWFGGDRIKKGTPAPALKLRALTGETVDLTSFRGRKVVLEFWAPWCKVCRWQVGALNDLHDARRATVLSVVLDYQSVDDVRRFIREHGVRYPVLLGARQTSSEFRVDQFPTIYVIDERGTIDSSRAGYSPGWLLRLWL